MKPILFIVILTSIVYGCSTPIRDFPAIPTETYAVRNPTETVAVASLTPTYKIRPTLTPSALSTPAPSETTPKCLSLLLDSKQLPKKEYGTVVIDSLFIPKWTFSDFIEPYLFEIPEHKITLSTKVQDFRLHTFAVSPDQTRIAVLYGFSEPGKDDFFVFDHNGKLITSLDFPPNLAGAEMAAWLNKGILLKLQYINQHSNVFTNYVLFDPRTQKRENLQTSFLNHYSSDYNYRGTDEIYYDPSLTYAIYFAAEKDKTNELYYSLWDISNNREVTRFNVYDYSEGAAWSPNSEFSILQVWRNRRYELIRLHSNGHVETIAHGKVDQYSISPDSKLLAYWLVDENRDNSSTLYVMNLQTNEVINYCLQTPVPIGMVWSPDSNNLAASFEYNFENEKTIISAIIDFEQRKAYRIDNVSIAVGWLK